MNNYRYKFEKTNKKDICPDCEKRTYVRYLDTKTNEKLPYKYGRCDREQQCQYHLNPYKDGYSDMIYQCESGNNGTVNQIKSINTFKPTIIKKEIKPVYFDTPTYANYLKGYQNNQFMNNLLKNVDYPFEAEEIQKVCNMYLLGNITEGYMKTAITFPFIDIEGNIRAVQVKEFDSLNHTIRTGFLHAIIENKLKSEKNPLPQWLTDYKDQDLKISCLFGEHLLKKFPNSPVILVEAPKTAIYCWLYFNKSDTFLKNCICLAVYNKSSFSYNKIKALKDRTVIVFPDASKNGDTFKEWQSKALEFEKALQGTKFIFSDILERLATEEDKIKGIDIADILITKDWRYFRKKPIEEKQPQPDSEKITKVTHQHNIILPHPDPLSKVEVFKTKRIKQHNNWNKEIAELESYFANIELPTQPIKLKKDSIITDCSLFIESNLATVNNYNGIKTFLPHLNRLQELRQVLTINSN